MIGKRNYCDRDEHDEGDCVRCSGCVDRGEASLAHFQVVKSGVEYVVNHSF
jgi:hypothetical protein